jgi:hypothetical protein
MAFNHLSESFLRRHNYESLGDGLYARADPDPQPGGIKSVEVHIYRDGPGLEKAIADKRREPLLGFEKGIWALDRDSQQFGWSEKHGRGSVDLTSAQADRLNGVVVNKLREFGSLPPKGVSGRGNAAWTRGLGWIGRAAGAAGVLAGETSHSRYCAFYTPDTDGC